MERWACRGRKRQASLGEHREREQPHVPCHACQVDAVARASRQRPGGAHVRLCDQVHEPGRDAHAGRQVVGAGGEQVRQLVGQQDPEPQQRVAEHDRGARRRPEVVAPAGDQLGGERGRDHGGGDHGGPDRERRLGEQPAHVLRAQPRQVRGAGRASRQLAPVDGAHEAQLDQRPDQLDDVDVLAGLGAQPPPRGVARVARAQQFDRPRADRRQRDEGAGVDPAGDVLVAVRAQDERVQTDNGVAVDRRCHGGGGRAGRSVVRR
jgi:hypothetical protein